MCCSPYVRGIYSRSIQLESAPMCPIIAGRDTEGLIEVRCRSPRTGKIEAREWFPVGEDHEPVRRFIMDHARRRELDVYVGVAPRTKREGGKSAIRRVWCLWVDCDESASVNALRAFSPAPTLIVGSGTGDNVHAYWQLSHPLAPEWAERANRRLAHHLGADLKATDAARILRPPGTLNWKHDPPTPVEVESFTGTHYTAADVVKNLVDPPSKPHGARPTKGTVGLVGPLDGVSSVAYYEALTGWEGTTGAHVRCPFWDHRSNPAMVLYEGGTWHCFACGQGGSVYEFAALRWGYHLPVRGTDFVELRDRLQREIGVVG